MRHRIGFVWLLLGVAALSAADSEKVAVDDLSYDLVPAADQTAPSARSAASDCRIVTEMRLLPTTGAGWLALLDEAVRGLCDLNMIPSPRIYRLVTTADEVGTGFSGKSADGRAIAVRFTAPAAISVSETGVDGKVHDLVGIGQLPPQVAVGAFALQSEGADEVAVTLCLDQDRSNAEPIAWLTSDRTTDCDAEPPSRLYSLELEHTSNDLYRYRGRWIAADGLHGLAIELNKAGLPHRVAESPPSGAGRTWVVAPDGSTPPTE